MAAPKKAAPSAPESAAVTTTSFRPVEDGVAVVADRAEPSLDPDLAAIRDAEIKAQSAVTIEARPEPTIDPALEAARDAEIKRQAAAVKAAS